MNDAEKHKLWKSYMANRTLEVRETLIIEYSGLVKVVAKKLGMYLGYAVELDDLIGYGVFGLIDAIDKFDYHKGVKFETYASVRIRGAILDQIRKMDWIPRTVRQKQKRLEQAVNELEVQLGRAATNGELANHLEITVSELENWQTRMSLSNIVSWEEFIEQGSEVRLDSAPSKFEQPEQRVEKEELKKMLVEALDGLTENEKKVILFYYYEDLTLKEISKILEVSESRISQLHTKALQKMKVRLGSNVELLRIFS